MSQERYRYTTINGIAYSPPLIPITERDTDKYEKYVIGVSRLDKISYKYYTNPEYGYLILTANPEYTHEFDIPDNSIIRIPFPLNAVLDEFDNNIKKELEI